MISESIEKGTKVYTKIMPPILTAITLLNMTITIPSAITMKILPIVTIRSWVIGKNQSSTIMETSKVLVNQHLSLIIIRRDVITRVIMILLNRVITNCMKQSARLQIMTTIMASGRLHPNITRYLKKILEGSHLNIVPLLLNTIKFDISKYKFVFE